MKKILLCLCITAVMAAALISCDFNVGEITTPTLNPDGDRPTENSTVDKNESNKPSEPEVIGLKYELNEDKQGYTVIGFGKLESTDLVIDTYNSLPVTAIAEKALYNATTLKSVTIGKSVKDIGASAFYNCSSLEKVCIADIRDWYEIDFGDRQANPLYYAHKLYVDGECITELVIPEGLGGIGSYTFSGCEAFTSVTFPADLIYVKTDAFFGCNGIRRVNISDLSAWCKIDFATYDSNPLYYGHDLYLGGTLLTELTVPADVERISSFAFYNCNKLTSLSFGDTLKKIGANAFSACVGLTEISFSDSIEELEAEAFAYCAALKKVSFGKGMERIGSKVFQDCTLINEVRIESINDWLRISFASQNSNPLYAAKLLYVGDAPVTEITVDAPIKKISDFALINCETLEKLTISDSVESIGARAFEGCKVLSDVIIGNGVTEVKTDAFKNCTHIKYKSENKLYYLGNKENPYVLLVFTSSKSQRQYEINPATKIIYGKAFQKCSSLSDMVIPDSVVYIGDYCFENCTSLIKMTIGTGVKSIGYAAFNGCKGLMGIVIPDNVTYIGAYAFYSCETLAKVTVGNGLKSIEECTFYFCKRLSVVELGSGLEKIGSAAFYYCSSLRSISIPDSVLEICDRAFENCPKITDVTLGKGVTTIGQRAFYNCSALTTVEGGEGLVTLDSRVFGMCVKLNTVSLGKSLSMITNDTFYKCSTLWTISFGGTAKEWRTVEKQADWNGDMPSYTVKCTDGDITKANDK